MESISGIPAPVYLLYSVFSIESMSRWVSYRQFTRGSTMGDMDIKHGETQITPFPVGHETPGTLQPSLFLSPAFLHGPDLQIL